MSIKIVRKVVTNVEYKLTTNNGHVVWKVTFDDNTSATTKPDSSFGLTITRSERGLYSVEIDGRGRIVGWEREEA
jgi:hypothetical protein